LISSNSYQFERLKELRQWLYREVKIAKYSSVLDIGAGDLKISAEIAGHIKGKVHALDIVEPRSVPEEVIFVKGMAEELPFDKETFDIISAGFLFFWIKDLDRAVSEIKRTLKKEGLLLIISEPLISERLDTPDAGLNLALKNGLMELGANLNIEDDLNLSLEKAGFKAEIFKTKNETTIDDKNEIFEEIELLYHEGLIGEWDRDELTRFESRAGKRKVTLPILYGWASINK